MLPSNRTEAFLFLKNREIFILGKAVLWGLLRMTRYKSYVQEAREIFVFWREKRETIVGQRRD